MLSHVQRAATCSILISACALAQAPLTFDVASIRDAEPITAMVQSGKLNIGMKIDAARVDIGSMSLADLLPIAFGVKAYQISGPSWMRENRFNIVATIPDGATKEQVPQMLQALLVERFGLKFHKEGKDQSIYALVVGKGGPKLKESEPDADLPPPPPPAGAQTINTPNGNIQFGGPGRGAVLSGGPMGTTRMSMGPNGMHLESSKMTLTAFAELLTRFVDRPVMDLTDVKGTYQIGLDLGMDQLMNAARSAGMNMPGGPRPGMGGGPGGGLAPAAGAPSVASASDPSGGSLFQAVQQLGLKLEPRKAPVDMIVIDHLEKTPSEN